MSKDKYFIYKNGCWMHRTYLKRFINPLLRFIQFYTDKPYVIYSICEKNNEKWHFIKYGFGRIKYLKRNKE